MADKNEIAEDAASFEHATQSAKELVTHIPKVARAAYTADLDQLSIVFDSGICLLVPCRLLEGLADASPEQLSAIEISPSGFGLHFPAVDADVNVPALLHGVTGSKRWMAAEMGQRGGRVRSARKAQAARTNGRKGGRPRRGS
jgi:hypothetical protein